MFRKIITSRIMVPVLLAFQVVPLIIFPLKSYSLSSQEWWLPMVLTLLALIALVQVLARHNHAPWPWYLLSFAQGFNIISRLMMVMPHATSAAKGGGVIVNGDYLVVAFVSMLLSAFEIWYCELPEVHQRVLSKNLTKTPA
jgi:hypothetical protein